MAHITFIHGIANKPASESLLRLWVNALKNDRAGTGDIIDLNTDGVTSSMVYWADVLYEKPLEDEIISEESFDETGELVAAEREESSGIPDMSWRQEIAGEEKATVEALALKLNIGMAEETLVAPLASGDEGFERVPLPWFVKQRIMKKFLRDVHHYLFNYDFSPRLGERYMVQEEIRNRTIKILKEGATKSKPHIIVGHSMGTVIAYDCLKRVPDCPEVDGLMTIGSPLGLDEIQDKLRPEWTRENGFPEKLKGGWINIYDRFDPVACFDGDIADDYKKNGEEVIKVINEQNWGEWRHDIAKYMCGAQLRAALIKLLGF